MDTQALITSILGRKGLPGGHGRISTARACKSHLEHLIQGGLRPSEAFGTGSVNHDDLTKRLAEMDGKLIYHDDGMKFLKATKVASELSANSLMDFECVITSKSMDRDGDILEPKGAIPDSAMPFLWQHNAALPVGKLLQITDHSASRLCGKFAIYDVLNGLGKDTAFLIENGALRISHGFVPEPGEYEPLDEKDGGGWHVRKFKVLETSGVSVPSNPDAVITGYSRGKFCNPMVKGWAKEIFDARPASVPGYSLREKMGEFEREIKVATHEELKEHLVPKDNSSKDPASKDTASKDTASKDTAGGNKSFFVELAGSWGDIQAKLQDTLLAYLLANGVRVDSDQTAYICEMFDDRAVVCIYDYYSGAWSLYVCQWKDADGMPQWFGQPTKAEVTGQLQERMAKLLVKSKRTGRYQLRQLSVKVGRALSAKTEESLRDAKDLVNEVANRSDVPKPAKTQLKEAIGLLNDVLSQVEEALGDDGESSDSGSDAGSDSGQDAAKQLDAILAQALGKIFTAGAEHVAECERFLMSAAGVVAATKADQQRQFELETKEHESRLWESIHNGLVSVN